MEFKKGQAVKFIVKRNGVMKNGAGKFVAEHKGAKGNFFEIERDEGKGTIKVRPVNVTAK